MKKRIKNCAGGLLAAGFVAVLLTACGSTYGNSSSQASYESAADTAMYDSGGGIYTNEAVMAEEYEFEDAAVTEEGTEASGVTEAAASERKLIKNVNLNVETEQFDSLMPVLEARVSALGGYIEEMSSYSRNNEYASGYQGTKYLRYANMTVRIPRENLDIFLEEIGERSNVVSRSESVTDVTLQYVDLESHKKALLTEQDRLLELMEQAETVEDIIAIEGRLSEVRYQIESMEAQLRTYDNKIDYSTVYLYVDEVEHYSPTENATAGERIRSGFAKSVEGVGRGIQNSAIWFLINIPYLLVWVIVIVIVILIIRVIIKKSAKRSEKRSRKVRNPYPVTPIWQNQTGAPVDIRTENKNVVPKETKSEVPDETPGKDQGTEQE